MTVVCGRLRERDGEIRYRGMYGNGARNDKRQRGRIARSIRVARTRERARVHDRQQASLLFRKRPHYAGSMAHWLSVQLLNTARDEQPIRVRIVSLHLRTGQSATVKILRALTRVTSVAVGRIAKRQRRRKSRKA